MKPETVSLLCSPTTREPLALETFPMPDGASRQVLVGERSGTHYPIRDGIPLLVDESKITGFNRRYQGIYNRIAGLYDSSIRLVGLLAGKGEGAFRAEYLQELVVDQGDRVLEVSIGTGANLRYLPPGGEYYGLDLSWGMLKKCQRNLPRWQRDADLILGNAEELPLRDGLFDTVFHVGGINAFNDPAKAINEMVRVAKPGAKVLIVDETAKLMEALAWMPSVRSWLRDHGDRFAPPLALVPPGMREVEARDIAKGNLYCLSFRLP